jgi:two-component system, OmpR family, phosphate regulon sensor histidine kinase PhoR
MTFKSPIFRKLFASIFLAVAALLLIAGIFLKGTNRAAPTLLEGVEMALVAAAIIALLIAYFFSRPIVERLKGFRDFADGLVKQQISGEPLAEGGAKDELGALAHSLNQASSQLHDLVDRINVGSSRLEAILSSMVEGVLAVDRELRVTFCNDSFLRAVGASRPIPDRLPLLELVREPDLLDLLTRVLVTGESCRQRLELSSPEERSFEVQGAPLIAPSRRGAVAILHDISELERLERVRKDFVANVSHELRTPLTAIQGYAETLLEGALEDPENNRKFLETIKAHAIRLNNIASDLLTLSELESGKPLPLDEEISIREAVEAAVRAVEPAAGSQGVKLVMGELADVRVAGNRMRLEQALINLLDNGVKFNRPGGEVRVEAAPWPDGRVRITIADTGIGIPSQDLSRIFERFYRVDKARSREAGGTGLGLSIVRHIIERMNGTVHVESQLGKGTTFSITLQQVV